MSLERVLNPSSVAIVGASKNPQKRGFQAIRTLLEDKFEGEIYPVNPKETSVMGLKCYQKISDIEAPVDLALITTPAATIPGVLEQCGEKGVAGAVIVAGGFREAGEKGKALEKKMTETAAKYGVRLIGPNTSGMINLGSNLNLVGLRDVPKGDIALLTQSGNLALEIITEASIKSRKGFSYYVGVGNESDIKFHEYLKYFREDPQTKAILMYVEGLRDGRTFIQEAYRTTEKKPIILLKSGRSTIGKRSAGSHTGSLAGMSEVALGAFRRAGIITIDKTDQLFPAAETLASLPPLRNNKIAILADGGGHATIAADLLSDYGIEIPILAEQTQKKLRKILPANAAIFNPVDVAGGTDANPEKFAEVADILLKDRSVGGLLLVGLFGGYGIRFDESLSYGEEDAAHLMGKLVKSQKKPIIVHSLYNFMKPHSLDLLRYYNIPVYDSLDVACNCMHVLAQYGEYLHNYHQKVTFVMQPGKKAHASSKKIIKRARKEGRRALFEFEAKEIFREHGVSTPCEFLVTSADEAVSRNSEFEGPVAMKIVSSDILHKSEAGGVKLGLKTAKDIKKAYNQIIEGAHKYNPDANVQGVLMTSMIESGLEVIIGAKMDDVFGPVIMFGIGGVMVEVLKDVVFRVLPISFYSAKAMIKGIRSTKLLDGYRGSLPYDKKALAKLLTTVSEVVEAYPQIEELDLNPVIVHHEGLCIADARIILKEETVN